MAMSRAAGAQGYMEFVCSCLVIEKLYSTIPPVLFQVRWIFGLTEFRTYRNYLGFPLQQSFEEIKAIAITL
jgi:hypothetical protein